MEAGELDNWWEGKEDNLPEILGSVKEFDHESAVIVHNKSPLGASLPWIAVTAFATLMMQGTAAESSPTLMHFFVIECSNVLFVIVLIAILVTNEELGARISVNSGDSLIWVGNRGFRTDFKQVVLAEYEDSSFIRIFTRKESVENSDGGTGIATYFDICVCNNKLQPTVILTTNGPLSRRRARKIGKSLARATGLDFRK